jgi:hypothetical protein
MKRSWFVELFLLSHLQKHLWPLLHALGITATPTIILPDYGSSPPYYSAIIPFVGSSVVLGSIHEGPFIAVYEVFADSGQPKIVSNIESDITNNNNTAAVTTANITNTGVP